MRTLGSAAAAAGEMDTGRLVVGETRDGTDVGLPVAIVNGKDSGETLYIQAVSDGDEVNGLGVIRQLLPRLDPTALSGTILVVAIANYHAFQVAEHRNPIDDTKLNRAYPGDSDGSSSERLAHATFEVAKRADRIVDLHQGSTSRMIDEVRVRCGHHHRLHDECLEFARVFDAGYVLDQKGPEGQLARVGPDEGIPTIDPELGGSVGWDERSIEIGVSGIENVLQYYGYLSGSTTPGSHVRAKRFDRHNAPVGGLVTFERDLEDRVEPGDVLFTVTDPFGSEKAAVVTESSGIVWRTRRLPQVATGEYVCSVATEVDSI
ncbi:MAG: succinylglutamate desuccinylase/aspartoacylase family protein [Halodesulfurarchaeum sp.]